MSNDITFYDINKIGSYKGSIVKVTIEDGKYGDWANVLLTEDEYKQLPAQLRQLLEHVGIIYCDEKMKWWKKARS